MVNLAQINVGWVFEDETADVLLLDEVAVAVLLWRAGCPSKFGFQMSALDPARYRVRIDATRLCKTVGGVEAPAVLEFHSFQLEMDGGHGTGEPGSLQLETDSLIAHPCVP